MLQIKRVLLDPISLHFLQIYVNVISMAFDAYKIQFNELL